MIGPNPSGKGGIASVASGMIKAGFLQKHNIEYIISHEYTGSVLKGLVFLRAEALVLSKCIFDRPTVVHIHASIKGSFFRKSMILWTVRLFGCKTIFHLHSGYFKQYVAESNSFRRWWMQKTLKKSTIVIALSKSWAAFLTEFAPGCNVEVIPNSIALHNVNSHLTEMPFRILFLGVITESKGVFELLEAVSILKPSFPEIKLILGGSGDLNLLNAKAEVLGIAANIETPGWIEADKKNEELANASIFALPSHHEGLPMSMLEAMSAGKAVIVTPVGGIPEVITDGENGLLVPVKSSEVLASAIRRLFENKTLHQTLKINARNTIVTTYQSDVVLTKLSALYTVLEN